MIKSNHGFTLVEVVIATGISGVVILFAFAFIAFVSTKSSLLKTMNTRDYIQNELVYYLGSLKTIRATRLRDPIVRSCFGVGSETDLCPGQDENLGVSIYNAAGDRLAGPPNDPVFYSSGGFPCTENCAIEVTATARPQGLPVWWSKVLEVSPGRRFEFVELRYKIRVLTAVDGQTSRVVTGSVLYDTLDIPETL